MKSVPVFEEVFRQVWDTDGSVGIVPMDNSTTGCFKETYDCLQKYGVHIVGEWYQTHDLCLCAKPGTKLKDVQIIYSHPAVLDSCSKYIRSAKVKTKATSSTSAACQHVAKGSTAGEVGAAFASRAGAKAHGLEILKTPVSNDHNLTSRFVLISKSVVPSCMQDQYQDATLKWKCSIAVDLVNKPLSIIKTLSLISFKDLNISSVNSFPL